MANAPERRLMVSVTKVCDKWPVAPDAHCLGTSTQVKWWFPMRVAHLGNHVMQDRITPPSSVHGHRYAKRVEGVVMVTAAAAATSNVRRHNLSSSIGVTQVE